MCFCKGSAADDMRPFVGCENTHTKQCGNGDKFRHPRARYEGGHTCAFEGVGQQMKCFEMHDV